MTNHSTANQSKHNKLFKAATLFWLVLVVAIVFGYSLGKDMALRDNVRDAAVAQR